jgi:hypothetical protein
VFHTLPSDRRRVIGAIIIYKKYVHPAGIILLKQGANRVANYLCFVPRRNNDSNGPHRDALLLRWRTWIQQSPESTPPKD